MKPLRGTGQHIAVSLPSQPAGSTKGNYQQKPQRTLSSSLPNITFTLVYFGLIFLSLMRDIFMHATISFTLRLLLTLGGSLYDLIEKPVLSKSQGYFVPRWQPLLAWRCRRPQARPAVCTSAWREQPGCLWCLHSPAPVLLPLAVPRCSGCCWPAHCYHLSQAAVSIRLMALAF